MTPESPNIPALLAEVETLKTRAARYERALRTIAAGSGPTGRWLDAHGHETNEADPEATWEAYTEEENASWLETVTRLAEEALIEARL